MKKIEADISKRAGLLAGSALFSGISARNLHNLAEKVSLREYAKGEIVFSQDSPADGFFILLKGSVSVYRLSADGKKQILHSFSEKTQAVGEVPVFQGGNYPATAEAQKLCELLYVPGDEFLDFAMQNPSILLEMLAVLSLRLRRFVGLVDDLSLKEVPARLAKYLIDLSVRQGTKRIELDVSKTALADRLATAAETLSRALKKMRDKDIIDMQGPVILILDTERLTAVAAGEKF